VSILTDLRKAAENEDFWYCLESTRPISRSDLSCVGTKKKVGNQGECKLTPSVPREELCAHLRAAIAEQKRIDATYASHEGSISSSQAAAMSIEARPAKAADIRLILPPDEFGPKGKSRPVKKNRHTTKVCLSSQSAAS
jgi:hypothetical protein